MVPLPYKILIVVVAAVLCFGGGAYVGYQYCDGQLAKAVADAKDAALEGAREEAAVDKKEAIDRVRRETVASERARSAKDRGMSDASSKARPDCVRDPESLGLLLDAISAANGTEAGPGGVPKTMPGISSAKERVRPGSTLLGVRYD